MLRAGPQQPEGYTQHESRLPDSAVRRNGAGVGESRNVRSECFAGFSRLVVEPPLPGCASRDRRKALQPYATCEH